MFEKNNKSKIMKRTTLFNLLMLAVLGVGISACTTTKNGGTIPIVIPPPADAIKDTYAGGIISGGTFLSGHTYNINKGNIIVNGGTVTFQAGTKILFGGKPQIIHLGYHPTHHDLHINIAEIQKNISLKNKVRNQLGVVAAAPAAGDSIIYSVYLTGGATFVSQGTAASHVIFSTSIANPLWPNGYWGGINCDSTTKAVTMQYTDISYTGGSDSIKTNQYAFYIHGSSTTTTPVIIENSSFQYGVDDCTRLEGGLRVSIKGNVFKKQGSNDGDGVNIKGGVMGDVAYNYCWSGANNSIKLNANLKNLAIRTTVNVYNNTIINGGWRKVGEVSSGILVDANAQGSVYNNLIVDCRNGLRITSASDTLYNKGKFGNNYMFAVLDSTAKLVYGTNEWGKAQATDIYSLKGGDQDPMIANFVRTTKDAAGFTTSPTDQNDPHLKAGSPAIGKGNPNAPYNNSIGTNMGFMPGKDIGAYQTDGTGNQRIN